MADLSLGFQTEAEWNNANRIVEYIYLYDGNAFMSLDAAESVSGEMFKDEIQVIPVAYADR